MEAAALALQRALSRGGRPGPDAEFVSDAVVSRSDEVGGRGLFSTRALDVGEELLRVAHAALITAKVGQATAEGAALKRAADEFEDGGDLFGGSFSFDMFDGLWEIRIAFVGFSWEYVYQC